jgi:hypothetical protein
MFGSVVDTSPFVVIGVRAAVRRPELVNAANSIRAR